MYQCPGCGSGVDDWNSPCGVCTVVPAHYAPPPQTDAVQGGTPVVARPADYGAPAPPYVPPDPVPAGVSQAAHPTEPAAPGGVAGGWGDAGGVSPGWTSSGTVGAGSVVADSAGWGAQEASLAGAYPTVSIPKRNPHSRVDTDLLSAMHESHQGPKRPWLAPLVVLLVVVLGLLAWMRFVFLTPPDLREGEIAFGDGAYAALAPGFEVSGEGDGSSTSVLPQLAGGDVYTLTGSGATLGMTMVGDVDTNYQEEYQKLAGSISQAGGALDQSPTVETELGPAIRTTWSLEGRFHVSLVAVHERRAVYLDVSAPSAEEAARLADPMIAGLRATGKNPVVLPDIGRSFWFVLGALVIGAIALGLLSKWLGRSAVGGCVLGAVVGVAAGIVVSFLA